MSLFKHFGGCTAIGMVLDRYCVQVMEDPRVSVFFQGEPLASSRKPDLVHEEA